MDVQLEVTFVGDLVRVLPNPAQVNVGDRVTWILPATSPDLRVEFAFFKDRDVRDSQFVPIGSAGPFESLISAQGQISGRIRNFSQDPPVHRHRFFYKIFMGDDALDWENPVDDKQEAFGINGGGIDVPARPPIT